MVRTNSDGRTHPHTPYCHCETMSCLSQAGPKKTLVITKINCWLEEETILFQYKPTLLLYEVLQEDLGLIPGGCKGMFADSTE